MVGMVFPLLDSIPEGTIITANNFSETLRKLVSQPKQQVANFFWRNSASSEIPMVTLLPQLGNSWVTPERKTFYPSCSPGLAPNDFHFFPKLKKIKIKNKMVGSNQALQYELTAQLVVEK